MTWRNNIWISGCKLLKTSAGVNFEFKWAGQSSWAIKISQSTDIPVQNGDISNHFYEGKKNLFVW